MTTDLRPTAELREIGDETWHRNETTGWAWVRLPIDALTPWWTYMAMYVGQEAAA